VLLSQLGSGTNTTAALPSGSSSSSAASNGPQINGGGSAEGNRGGSSDSPSSTETGFQQGGEKSQASSFRRISHIVAVWSGVVTLVVGGMFTLL